MTIYIIVGLSGGPLSDDEEDDDFYDAVDEQTEEFKVCLPPEKGHK